MILSHEMSDEKIFLFFSLLGNSILNVVLLSGQWCLTFGQTYANELRRRRPRCGDKWHLDEVYLKINGKTHYLWRAVDQDGNVLDMRVAEPTQQASGKTFFSQ